MIKAMADYQFGIGAGTEIIAIKEGERIRTTGKFPYYKLSSKGNVLARARRIENFLSLYRVEIGNFVPKGSILAPGVINASEQIRVNDEVIFCGEKVFGVGRAKMSGWEMVESRRGVAVQVREVEEKV